MSDSILETLIGLNKNDQELLALCSGLRQASVDMLSVVETMGAELDRTRNEVKQLKTTLQNIKDALAGEAFNDSTPVGRALNNVEIALRDAGL